MNLFSAIIMQNGSMFKTTAVIGIITGNVLNVRDIRNKQIPTMSYLEASRVSKPSKDNFTVNDALEQLRNVRHYLILNGV